MSSRHARWWRTTSDEVAVKRIKNLRAQRKLRHRRHLWTEDCSRRLAGARCKCNCETYVLDVLRFLSAVSRIHSRSPSLAQNTFNCSPSSPAFSSPKHLLVVDSLSPHSLPTSTCLQ